MTSLEDQAQSFAEEIAGAVSAFCGRSVCFKATQSGSRFIVTDEDRAGVIISLGDGANLTLQVSYRCELDSADTYLRVLSSSLAVFAGCKPSGDPLFRYDYVHGSGPGVPASHLHLHAHRDQFTRLMTVASMTGARRRQSAPGAELEGARMCKIHFPAGGHRFRPTLEDVLQLIAEEFGAPTGQEWPDVLRTNRITWRRNQTAAAVRDCPSAAVQALEALGYSVTAPETGAEPDREDRLVAY